MNITLSDLSAYIVDLIGAIGDFLSTGIMFYIMGILIFAMIINILIGFIRS